MKKSKICISAALMLLLVTGCASYRAAGLDTLPTEGVQSSSGGIKIAAKAFDKSDCRQFLDRDVIQEGYQPVQLYIQNNTDKSYEFSLSRISMSSARPGEVASRVHTSTVGRAVGYGVAALFIWPFAIPAIVDGMKSAEANDALDNDFAAKTAKDAVLVPHSQFNKLLFVPLSDYQSSFTVTLVDQESSQPIQFNVRAN